MVGELPHKPQVIEIQNQPRICYTCKSGAAKRSYGVHVFGCVNTDRPSNHVNQSFIKHATKSRLQPLRGNIGQTAACLRHSVSDRRLKSIKERKVPTMVVTGTIDNFINPAHSHHLQEMLDARLEIFEGSGHALPEEQSDRYNALLEEFFESTKTSKL
jgi:pimeloyl-ACP methyl ester carboxylesterase